MNGGMQDEYLHSVPKSNTKNRESSDSTRIVLVFRHGKPAQTLDSGHIATLQTRLNRPPPVQFGAIDGVGEGEVYCH